MDPFLQWHGEWVASRAQISRKIQIKALTQFVFNKTRLSKL